MRGSAGISAPDTVRVGERFTVALTVSAERLPELLQYLAVDTPENKNLIGREGVKLTPRMSAKLSGLGFEVSPGAPVVQAVTNNEPTIWHWQVKANQSGLLTLNFVLTGFVVTEGKETEKNFYDYPRKIQVDVSPLGFMGKYWQWAATTLVVPAIGALWAFLRRPRETSGVLRQSYAARLRSKIQTRA